MSGTTYKLKSMLIPMRVELYNQRNEVVKFWFFLQKLSKRDSQTLQSFILVVKQT